ncbi:glycosyltransferase involved in cell wall biosynthesis [Peteryoungia aggregata LMG 23059]|uniref:Glycosyltransferase involved in cell wall biosynthesis n=1 Tax=Peteryoungia aggregata LMG 23059 TaxID=1368425 RepID=A0ABU0G750_9HYPH|nr:glycosyltransferase family 4 protein [Peteryoungia aggregata]MDQ0420774.1 glycosyltransferase involved in cell wall biosynthesis [Peteryoungia aggregata LMG 23059]
MTGSLTFAYPGDLSLKTGGYAYDRQLIEGLRARGWEVDLLCLGEGFPVPSPHTLQQAEYLLTSLPDDSLVLIDGLAFGVLDTWAEAHAGRLRIVALVHHPLALETGIADLDQKRLHESERRALAAARHVIVTSPMTARELSANFGVEPGRITVALPGTEPGAYSTTKNTTPQILSVGTLSRRKGHDVLLSALKSVEDLDWQATIVGAKTLDPETSGALERQLEGLDLGGRVQLAGQIDDPRPYFMAADIFALASRYEGYGMVFAEALSHGLPIVACNAGAVPEVVPDAAGILVPVDDVSAFAAALRRLLQDEGEREARSKAARHAGALLPDWSQTARIISNSLDEVS